MLLPGFREYSSNDFIVHKTAIFCGKNIQKDKIKYLIYLLNIKNYVI